jgi:hypothetical protein
MTLGKKEANQREIRSRRGCSLGKASLGSAQVLLKAYSAVL